MYTSLLKAVLLGITLLFGTMAMAQPASSLAYNSPSRQATTSTPTKADTATGKAVSAIQMLKTRCLDTGLLRVSSSYVFQVIEPLTLGDRSFDKGDLIYAHVETVHGVAGRVEMRTDQVKCAKTQQMTSLTMVAAEQPQQPGVGIPHMLDGWKLNWASL